MGLRWSCGAALRQGWLQHWGCSAGVAAGQDAADRLQHSGCNTQVAAGQGAALLSASSECRCRPSKAPILREQRCPMAAQRTPLIPTPRHPLMPTSDAGSFGCTQHANLSFCPLMELILSRRVVTHLPPAFHSLLPTAAPHQAAPCWGQSCCPGQNAAAALGAVNAMPRVQPTAHIPPHSTDPAPSTVPIIALQFCRSLPHRCPLFSHCIAALESP